LQFFILLLSIRIQLDVNYILYLVNNPHKNLIFQIEFQFVPN